MPLWLRAGDVHTQGGPDNYIYLSKGGKQAKRELPKPTLGAIGSYLAPLGKYLADVKPADSLWLFSSDSVRGVTRGTFYGNPRRYLEQTGLPHHVSTSSATLRPGCSGMPVNPSKR